MKSLIGLFLLVATTFPAPAAALTGAQQAEVHKVVLARLRDSDSAKFSQLGAALQSTGEIVVCGTVNAKNGFGGYVGAAPFYGKLYDNGQFYLTKFAESVSEQQNLVALCKALGAAIPQ